MHRASPYTTPQAKSGGGGRNNSRTVTPVNANLPAASTEMDLCSYQLHLCRREKLIGYDFCLKHILEDKNAPYKQCNFHYRSQKRCFRPAPKVDKKDGYCSEHAKKALIARTKISSQPSPTDLTQKCLQNLSGYKRDSAKMEIGEQSGCPSASGSSGATKPKMGELSDLESDIHPFQVQARTAIGQPPIVLPPRAPDESEVDSDDDSQSVDNAWRGDGDSDAESVDSEMENPLKYAGYFTSEEVIRIMRDKLIRLQKLYIDQFQRLRYLLREERRAYRMALKREQEADVMPIHSQPRETIEEIAAYEEAKAMTHYNKPQGLDAVLHHELAEKRQRLSEFHSLNIPGSSSMSGSLLPGSGLAAVNSPSTSSGLTSGVKSKCSFNLTSTTKCGEVCIPLSKFCIKHILQDTNQVLFRPCGVSAAARNVDLVAEDDGPCETPIADIFESSTCVYHTPILPPITSSSIAETPKLDAAINTEVTANGDVKNGVL